MVRLEPVYICEEDNEKRTGVVQLSKYPPSEGRSSGNEQGANTRIDYCLSTSESKC